MSTSEMKNWTKDQFLKYVMNRTPSAQEIQLWSCQQLVLYATDQLNQPSGAVATYLQGLLAENGYGFANKRQKETLLRLRTAGEMIPVLIDILFIWLSSKEVIARIKPHKIIRTHEQFVTYLTARNVTIDDILSWPCEQFVRYVYEELCQQSATAANLLESLLHEDSYGFACDGQKDILVDFQKDIEVIQCFTSDMKHWLLREDEAVNVD